MSQRNSDGYYEAFWPRAERQRQGRTLARRPSTLEGKTIGFVWDYMFLGDQIFAALEEGLKARFPGIRFIHWSEFGNTHGPDERKVVAALPERLRALGVDAVISGMAC